MLPQAALAADVELAGAELSVRAQDIQTMYRLYNPYTGEHFYTSDSDERADVRDAGWAYEGIGWVAPGVPASPVFRLYNPFAGEHHYTLDPAERDNLVAAGWTDEGIGWHSDDAKAVPVYREYNPNEPTNNHNYTADPAEHDSLVALGWVNEGVGWYALEAQVEDPYAKEAEEDRRALQEREAAARHQAAVDAAVANGMDIYTGTVRILTGRECCTLLLGKDVKKAGYIAYGHDPSSKHAVLLIGPDTTVRAWSIYHGGKVGEMRAGDGFAGVVQPAIGLLRDGAEDIDYWESYDGQQISVAINPTDAVISMQLPANACLVNPKTAFLIE